MDITRETAAEIAAAGGPIPWAEARRAERRAAAPTWSDGIAVLATCHLPDGHPARRSADEIRWDLDEAADDFGEAYAADVGLAVMLVGG